jgi:hypothetical protein
MIALGAIRARSFIIGMMLSFPADFSEKGPGP